MTGISEMAGWNFQSADFSGGIVAEKSALGSALLSILITGAAIIGISIIMLRIIIAVVIMRISVRAPMMITTIVSRGILAKISLVTRMFIIKRNRAALLESFPDLSLRDSQHGSRPQQDSENPAESHPFLHIHQIALLRVG